ncbi:NAD(P)-dependent oxidoreductase [Chelatococcus sp. GCM10030263]|uniref:NAD(P)-dependent oxidoreductase n=1 Tax=Chelatococcus sp. GCM10030263 TaxID=3273387 RepID=UPI003605E39D
MDKQIAIGAAWSGALLERLRAALPGWSVIADAGADPAAARAATVLVPFHMPVGREFLAGSRIRLVQQFGVGLDPVDLEAAHSLGIAVANAPSEVSGMAASVAEGAVLLTLSCMRLPSVQAASLAAGEWNWRMPLNRGLAGRRAGLIGFGSIGKAIARRLAAFDMRLVAVRRSGGTDDAAGFPFDWIGGPERIEELASTSDVVVISAPLTAETRGLFDAALIGRMRPEASIVNVGRGPILDEAALLAALDAGRVHAAGLDVLSAEPPPADSPLLSHPRIVLTPHDAGVSDQAFDGVARIIADNLGRLETGQPLKFRVV